MKTDRFFLPIVTLAVLAAVILAFVEPSWTPATAPTATVTAQSGSHPNG